jgi:hypothetical protein
LGLVATGGGTGDAAGGRMGLEVLVGGAHAEQHFCRPAPATASENAAASAVPLP